MKKLIALTNIDHDGKRYALGDALEVSDDTQAQALVTAGAAELKGSRPKPEPAPEPAPEA